MTSDSEKGGGYVRAAMTCPPEKKEDRANVKKL